MSPRLLLPLALAGLVLLGWKEIGAERALAREGAENRTLRAEVVRLNGLVGEVPPPLPALPVPAAEPQIDPLAIR